MYWVGLANDRVMREQKKAVRHFGDRRVAAIGKLRYRHLRLAASLHFSFTYSPLISTKSMWS